MDDGGRYAEFGRDFTRMLTTSSTKNSEMVFPFLLLVCSF